MLKLSVVTITYRPGYIDSMVQSLKEQTLSREDWEWILVDDIHSLRKDVVAAFVDGSIQYQHLPPREVRPYSATAIAMNTGLAAARGQLVYFMADYMYLHPRCLERHWQIYREQGPRVFISGPLVDDLVYHGWPIWNVREGRDSLVQVGEKYVTYKEFLPPLYVAMKPGANQPRPDNLLSIWKWPVHIEWPEPPEKRALDWRMLVVGKKKLGPEIFEATRDGADPSFSNYWWAGRNDSAGLSLLREAGGLDESQTGVHGGLETVLAQRMLALGARYLFDNLAPAAILPHPFRKPEAGWGNG